MAKRKRASTRSRFLNRAVKAGRSAIREAERRVPPDLRKQLERTIKDGQKTVQSALKDVQAQIQRTAKQADVDKVLKRLDAVSKQVQQLARSASSGATARPATAKPARRTPATRERAPATAAPKKAAPSAAAPRRAAAARRPRVRPVAPPAMSEVMPAPPAPMPGPVPERVDGDSSS
jgi:polyhydroxyalkanoate synthesis regulator phasin